MPVDISELLFDERVSKMMEMLEGGPAGIDELASEYGDSANMMMEQLKPLLEAGILREDAAARTLSVNKEKLDKALESDQAFGGVVDGLTKMDGYLN